jgi:formylglycine-generating enzyme required for sulfatase activity
MIILLGMMQDVPAAAPANQLQEFVSIAAGTFEMGADLTVDVTTGEKGIFIQDEFPSRQVTVSQGFDMASREISNIEYEQYDAAHRTWRGKASGISTGDNEAVVYVTWEDAVGYCRWRSARDARYDYRLPTEAEWEYACRAGTRTAYNDGIHGNIFSLNPLGELAAKWQVITNWLITRGNGNTESIAWSSPRAVDLTVGKQGPNRWGLYDMHGGVEEWCWDWYGPYDPTDTVDPVGYCTGTSKVVRGGSHNVHLQTLRSANRSSALRNDRHFLLGFRIVRVPKGQQLPAPRLKQQAAGQWAKNVSQRAYEWSADRTAPHFRISSLYEIESEYGTPKLQAQFALPLYTHNHSPAITWAQNGDLLLTWFTGESEKGQELTIPALRARRQQDGSLRWDTRVSEFYKAADRNMHGAQMWNNATRLGNGVTEPFTLYHINAICTDGKWSKLAMSFRQSTDNGVTWSEPVIMKQETDALHLSSDRNQPQGNVMVARDGAFLSFSDGSAVGGSGSSVNWSGDGGKTWSMRTVKDGPPGNHVGGVELLDSRILAFSRDNGRTFGRLPQSVSIDQGKTWSVSKTEFPPVSTFQRLALLRLEYSSRSLDPEKRGRKPLLLVSFADKGMKGVDANRRETIIFGSYAALSWDEGQTWPIKRVLSDVSQGTRTLTIGPWNAPSTLDATHGQHRSYWAGTQTPDGVVHLTDGRLYYELNLAWLTALGG